MRHLAILTSGGDSPGMNNAIRAAVLSALSSGIRCTGVKHGYDGLIRNELIPLTSSDVEWISNRGGTILKTARSAEFPTDSGMDTAALHLHQAGVDALLVIGGDGSFRGLNAFSARHPFRVAGIPGTIDNDLSGTDFTLGFDTAVNTAVQCMDKILDTAESHDRLFFVEVMGRDAGHIALHAGLAAGAHSILIPEDRGDIERLFEALQNNRRRTPFLVVVSEAEKEDNAFGLAEKVRTRFPELDVRVTVLGHLQRGGSPSYADRLLGTRMGSAAVQALQAGRSGFMCGIQNGVIAEVPLQYCVKSQTPPARDLLQLSAMKWHK